MTKETTCSDLSLATISPTAWKGTLDELRSFTYFRVQTSEDLAYSLNASLEELVLQTSHHHEAIRHAAIALGSLGHTIRINSSAPSRPSSALERHQFAYGQYYKAIKLLQNDIARNDSDSIKFALISCFLFVVFEFLQGNDPIAVTHLRSGLNIVRQHYVNHVDVTTDTKSTPPVKLDSIQIEIARIFHILDAQATMWLELRTSRSLARIPVDSPISREMIPEPYSSLDEACQDLNDIISRVYHFRVHASVHDFARTTADVPAAIYTERDSLLDELDIHRRRLCMYLTDREAFFQQPEDPHRITVLRINRKITTIMLATYLEPPDPEFDANSQPHFWQVVSLATLILRPETSEVRQKLLNNVNTKSWQCGRTETTKHQQRQIFSFFAGLIQPLYFTAIKSPNQETAMKAIELLEMEPWREGSWDSAEMAKLARVRVLESRRWRWRARTPVGSPTVLEKEEGLSNEWPLATDPLITYPV